MSDLIWLSEAQMRRIEPYFPLSHGVPRVDDRRIISGIIFVIRNGLRCDLPPVGPAVITRVRRFDIRARPPAQARQAGRFHLAGTPGALVPAFGSPTMSVA